MTPPSTALASKVAAIPWNWRYYGRASPGLKRSALLQHSPIVYKHAFDAGAKMMATVHRRGEKYLFAVKGAPEAVLAAADKSSRTR